MSHRLFELVEFEKSVRGVIKDRLKSLRKTAKKARKGAGDASAEELRAELDGLFELVAAYVDTAAAREVGERAARTDLEVDGEVILTDVSPRLLLQVKKPLKRLRKAARELDRLDPHPEVSAIASRADRLRSAIDRAVERANGVHVEEHQVAQAVLDYLRG